jgi:hypothetical protein
MANYDWTISHSSNQGTSYTNISSLCQNWTYRYGRRSVTDQWGSGAGTIEGVNPSSLPSISVGDWIKFSEGQFGTQFILAVADFTWTYNPAATADRWEIALEDALAQIGRIYLDTDASVSAGLGAGDVAWGLATTYGLNFDYYGGDSTTSAITDPKGTNGTQILQKLTNQAGAYIQAHRVDLGVKWIGYESMPWSGDPDNLFNEILFSDVAGNTRYNGIQFEGLADSYFDLIFVNPTGLDSQSAGSGVRAYSQETYNETEADALDWANYLLIQLGSSTQTPAQLVTIDTANEPIKYMPGNSAKITLRTNTYYATIEGGVISANPAQTRITLNLSDREALNYLLLNDAFWGKLDSNRLGY